jgi:hypothetical protein
MQAHHPSPPQQSSDIVLAVGSIGLVVTGAVMIYLINPVTSRLIPPCPFLWATNCYCPGCGAARAFHALVRGDLGTAFSYNPLLILALPALGYVYFSFLSGTFVGRKMPMPTGLRAWTWVIPVVIVIYWIARNLPWEPFPYLAP